MTTVNDFREIAAGISEEGVPGFVNVSTKTPNNPVKEWLGYTEEVTQISVSVLFVDLSMASSILSSFSGKELDEETEVYALVSGHAEKILVRSEIEVEDTTYTVCACHTVAPAGRVLFHILELSK
jgi:hypothetical protein